MKRSRLSTTAMLATALGLVAAGGTPAAKADFTFGEPVRFASVLKGADSIDCFSSDGLEMYIESDRAEGAGGWDLWVARRASSDEDWGPPENLGPVVNSPEDDLYSSISADGLTLHFTSSRPGGYDKWDIYAATRATKGSPWGRAVHLGPLINSASTDSEPWISPNGLELYFKSWRGGGCGLADMWVARRATANSPWVEPVNLGPVVNSSSGEGYLSLSPDGLLLLFNDSMTPGWQRPGGYGGTDLWVTRRTSASAPWQTPVNLGPKINSPSHDALPRISPDGCTLYFWSAGKGGQWQAPILPVVDFNGDGQVDGKDVLVMVQCWGANEPSCDIAPFAWGDGVVDVNDLKVLAEHIGTEVVDPTLLAHWALDEMEGAVAHDSAGTNHGMLIGSPAWQPSRGKVGGALQFDGGPRFVMTKLVCDPSAGPFSVLAWVKGGAPGQVILSQATGANWLTASVNGALGTGIGGLLESSTSITDGTWHRIGLVWDGSNRILYVDGVEVAKDGAANLAASTGGLYIGGAKVLAPGSFWSGLIDEVRIYSRMVHP